MTEVQTTTALPSIPIQDRAPTFRRQLAAVLHARWAVSRQQRDESPVGWWLQRVVLGLGAAVLVAGLLVLGFASGGRSRTDPARASVLFLMPALAMTGWLIAVQFRNAQASHPLGEALRYAPLPRLRSALLRTADSLAGAGNVVILLLCIAPWVSAEAAGARWLNGWALVSVGAYALGLISARELTLAIHRYAMDLTHGLLERTHGVSTAAVRIAVIVVLISLPIWTRFLAVSLVGTNADPFDLPALRWMRAAVGPAGLLVMAFASFAAAVWIRARPTPEGLTLRRRHGAHSPVAPLRPTEPQRLLAQRPAVAAMYRMMLVQASRRPIYRYSALVLVLFSGFAFVFQRAGDGFILFTAFIGPSTGFFNMYGADASYYPLWLGSGRKLSEWTLARQLFFLTYYALFGGAGFLLIFAAGRLPWEAAPLLAPLFLQGPLWCLLVGPPISRFVVTPHLVEISQRKTNSRSARAALAPVAVFVIAILVAVPGGVVIWLGWWQLNWLFLAAQAGGVLVARPHRAAWSPAFRARLAHTFRA